jgi:peptidoglycan/LPS O-acetylase OafA/YrhL
MIIKTSMSTDPQANHLTHPKYRPDIDGLRAIAVLSVVGFHAFPGLIKGGFVGVDIFFVISGFLISNIIFGSVERDAFSFVRFYSRRIRRIFPALLVVLAACYAFGWVSLLADEFGQLGKHIFGGATFVSNLVLWRESGYFDNDSATKPLLHLWSLGIEEQFYIVWPLLVWLAWRWRVGFLSMTASLAALSFSINVIYLFRSDHVADFYSPQTRFWELFAGSILAYVAMSRQPVLGFEGLGVRDAHYQSLIGALLLGAGLFVTTQESYFPGLWALLPVFGTVMIIGAGKNAFVNKVILSNGLFIWFGIISFPLYLWHWPLLSFARILENGLPNLLVRIVAMAVAIGLAWLTYKLVERPLRFGRFGVAKVLGLVMAVAMVGAVGYITKRRDGFHSRAVVKINIDSGWSGGDLGFSQDGCGVDGEAKMLLANCLSDSREEPRYALLGDSKAAALYGGLARTSQVGGRWLFIGGNGPNGAPVPLISNAAPYDKYQRLTLPAIQAVRDNKYIEQVALVTAMRNLGYPQSPSPFFQVTLEGLTNAVRALVASGKYVVLVIDNPTLLDPKDCTLRKTSLSGLNAFLKTDLPAGCSIAMADQLALSAEYRDILNMVMLRFPGRVRIFDTIPILCEDSQCRPFKDGRMLYSYSDHVSDYAAGMIGEQLNAFMATSR